VDSHFLQMIDWLTPRERATLSSLGAESAAALWGAIDASPDSFVDLLGSERAKRLSKQLWQMIPRDQRRIFEHSTPSPPPGVPVDFEPPPLSPTVYDVKERDRLFEELQRLRSEPGPEAKRKAERIEQELKTLLEGTV
jgi:hypothetical protein